MLHIVELSGIETEHNDKIVAKERKILATIDSTKILQNYARQCATDVLYLWDAPNIVKEFLKTGKNPAAAWAASDAARAASDAARASTWAARASATWAASDATWAARASAARASTVQKQRARLLTLVLNEFNIYE